MALDTLRKCIDGFLGETDKVIAGKELYDELLNVKSNLSSDPDIGAVIQLHASSIIRTVTKVRCINLHTLIAANSK
jgi:hypothetical protein